MYKVGELSKLCNISVKALRYYDAEGLLIPDEIDRFTGYRYYSASKLEDCYRIIALKELGFTLDEIKARLAAKDSAKIAELLEAKLAELNSLIENIEKQLRRIETMRNNLTEGELRMFDIIVKAADDMRVAYVRGIFADKSAAVRKTDEIAGALRKGVVGKRRIIINYETEYHSRDFDLAACAEILSDLPADSEYREKTVSFGGKTASLVCKSGELDEAYKAIIKYLDESDYKVCGAYYEIYHDGGTVELKVPVCERTDEALCCRCGDLPFVDDPDVCGKWRLIDVLPTREHFSTEKPKCSSLPWWLSELYFIDGGKGYWSVYGWTKGCLLTRDHYSELPIINKYTIENDGGRRLMFLEMNSYKNGGAAGFGKPDMWVYEKVEDKHYASAEEFERTDNTDYPFVNDEQVLGAWQVRDFVYCKEDFDPAKQNWAEDNLFVQGAEFKAGGAYVFTTKKSVNSVTSRWTKGLILNRRSKTACAYEIKLIDGREYLFIEWKSGDYVFGGRVYWYVFTRK